MEFFKGFKYALLISILFWALIILLYSCATFISLQPNCLDSAILAAETFKAKGYEVRLGYGMGKKLLHIMGQAKINGKWRWLKVDKIYTWKKDDFKVERYITIEEAKEYWRN